MNKEDNEVYFLGKNKPKQHSKRIYLYTLILLAILGISGWIYNKSTIKKTDNTEKFQILESPKEKAFEQAVISLLKESPQWAPAELTDGTKVNMEFTLPVSFKPEK